ncbi:hypothetical protein E8D34_14995 [Nocardioides sp. GY 10113]|uniref:hypothetical protein n=1 Tax=Nocardioides sp. GY 10113 TaxID=2569761 RepID=UPI0010A8C0EE|nr:hypothetical protein [Nocardioides sp. GY 10113]TIC83867.1 hypothetical protein E8D34_14995 [Nocardioides sp. GY 10113]
MSARPFGRGAVAALLACLAAAGCGIDVGVEGASADPFTLPVGPTEWDVPVAAWYHDGTLHVGDERLELGAVEEFVLGATGVYWVRDGMLMFTSAAGLTEQVAEVGWANLAISADRSVLATVDQSRGPTDRYGTHVLQVAAFDTRTGEQLYRTPDREPADGDDLADLYGEIMPLLRGVSDELLFFDRSTIHLDDGSSDPATRDAERVEVYEGYADTLFPDGYHVGIGGEGRRREMTGSEAFGVGRLSPDRSTLFDASSWPAAAVVYDATTGRQRRLDGPSRYFTLGGWSDEDTFMGIAERVGGSAKARQVVTCELASLACSPVSPVLRSGYQESGYADLLLEAGTWP